MFGAPARIREVIGQFGQLLRIEAVLEDLLEVLRVDGRNAFGKWEQARLNVLRVDSRQSGRLSNFWRLSFSLQCWTALMAPCSIGLHQLCSFFKGLWLSL